jgi:Protein kinase domain/RWD domain
MFAALQYDSSSSSGDSSEKEKKAKPNPSALESSVPLLSYQSGRTVYTDDWLLVDSNPLPISTSLVQIPPSQRSEEDLSTCRTDEETVLQAVYGDDFSFVDGTPRIWQIRVCHSPISIVLSMRIHPQYPYVRPALHLCDTTSALSGSELEVVLHRLRERADELRGKVMSMELVERLEEYLRDRRPSDDGSTRSAYGQQPVPSNILDDEEEIEDPSDSAMEGSPSPALNRSSQRRWVEQELLRQREALDQARQRRLDAHRIFDDVPANDDAHDDDDDDDDSVRSDDLTHDWAGGGGLSRYRVDFVELGVLGRGGGGEVVKVKNRLDRRVYAVKKIQLASEQGTLGKVWALQNRKLRREVTTISRMTHANIVRYYQAWVEGGIEAANAEPISEDVAASEEEENRMSEGVVDEETTEEIGDDDSSTENSQFDINQRLVNDNIDDDDSLFDYEDHVNKTPLDVRSIQRVDRVHSASMVNFLEQEVDNSQKSPLLSGLGFQNRSLYNLYDIKQPTATKVGDDSDSDDDDDENSNWDESSAKVESGAGKTILYIQMEYCSTTLRKMIDDGDLHSLPENDIWRLIRQILEALAYLHSRKIIHRYVVNPWF